MAKKDSIRLVFTGDIGFDRYMDKKWEDEELISREVLDFLHSGDHVIANVEGPLVRQERNTTTEGVVQLMHTMDPDATKVLKNMKADIWNLCNNHIMDAGEAGVEATLQEAQLAGALTIGAGMNLQEARRPVFFEEAGGIGMFAVGYRRGCKPADENKAGCYMWNEMDMIRESIQEIKSRCRWCVMVVHGGEEFTALPTCYTRDRYLEYLDMGADVIIAHHPHVPMNYETVGDKVIFYSLGNFIFDTDYQRAQFNTELGILVGLNFTHDGFEYEQFGIRIDRENEHIVAGEIPRICCDVRENEYRLLEPLAAKMFIAATRRQQIYLKPDEFRNATEDKWKEHFANEKRSGRVVGEGLDFFIICEIAKKEEEKAWERSQLQPVVDYILEQM